jgi:hypothetical protein
MSELGYLELLGRARAQSDLTWQPFISEKRSWLLACSGGWVSREKLAYLF